MGHNRAGERLKQKRKRAKREQARLAARAKRGLQKLGATYFWLRADTQAFERGMHLAIAALARFDAAVRRIGTPPS
jgi:hypothetical protein